ncbi:ABC transporter ATP-binding protein [Halomonas organivorans]|uniref:Lipopolysaccharide transport system ATP-binding protein n=1 Tax=Halomonas organivorans TaxID=257772 RepID=A0A7W5G6K6_9GAMM|nr:ABC transporter ATP-binding protein [Halomonas organivorans]MBB3142007.1 lipopolysaccharide transport system ATP-binding protein [Halomonas organivorans]
MKSSDLNGMCGDVIISLQNVGVRYKRRGGFLRKPEYFQALEGVSFDIHRGETLGILGRNGAGKSTLLRVVAGIIQPDSGEIVNHGVTVSLLALQAGFDAELPGTDNAILSGMLMGYTRKQVEARLDDIAEFSELGDFMYEPVKTYSSGMKSRLGFSVAMYMTPDVLLLDEVLSVGDKDFKKKAETEMMKKVHSNQTVLLVTHSEQQAKRLCERSISL